MATDVPMFLARATAPFGVSLAILADFAADADSLRPVFPKIRLPDDESEHDPKMGDFSI
jgi:hypothetical protein